MLKLLRSPGISGPLSVVLIFSFLVMTSGCNYFRVHKSEEPPRSAVLKLQDKGKLIILHLNDKVWQFVDIIATEDTISGSIIPIVGHERYLTVNREGVNRYRVNGPANEKSITNEVHIYTTGFSQLANSNKKKPGAGHLRFSGS